MKIFIYKTLIVMVAFFILFEITVNSKIKQMQFFYRDAIKNWLATNLSQSLKRNGVASGFLISCVPAV